MRQGAISPARCFGNRSRAAAAKHDRRNDAIKEEHMLRPWSFGLACLLLLPFQPALKRHQDRLLDTFSGSLAVVDTTCAMVSSCA